MCTSAKLWGNKTLNADYQNTKQFWENKSILREQFNFENKSWERLLEDLQSNFLRMLVKNITYMKLLDILNLSRTWKVGTLFRKFPAQRQPHHQQFTSTYQFNQGSHRGEILILPRPLCLQIHMSQLSELNFSSIGFRREVDENSKFKWIWGELVLFYIWGELVLGERTFDGILAKARQNFFMKRPQRSFNWREIRLMKYLSKTGLWSWRANRWKMLNSRNLKEKIIMDWHCASCRSFSES